MSLTSDTAFSVDSKSHFLQKKKRLLLDNVQSLFSFISLGSEGVYFVPAFNGLQVKLYCNVTSLKYLILCILSEVWCYMLLILSLFSTITVSPVNLETRSDFSMFRIYSFLDANILIGFILQGSRILSIKFCRLVIFEHRWLAGPALGCICWP